MSNLPPQDIEAEQAVLGSLLLDPTSIELIPSLGGEEFYRRSHRTIYEIISAMAKDKVQADVLLVREQLLKGDRLGEVGGTEYLNSLTSAIPSAANIEKYAAIVQKKAYSRRLLELGHKIIRDAETSEPQEIAALATETLNGATSTAGIEEPVTFAEALEEYIKEENQAAHPTGLPSLDEAMNGGLHFGGIILIGGDAKAGKTVMAMEMARAGMKYATPTYIVSRDQLRRHIAGRMWAGQARHFRDNLRESQPASRFIQEMKKWPLFFHVGGYDIDSVVANIKIAVSTKGVRLWVVDYLQRLTVKGSRAKGHEQAVIIADRLSDLAQDTNTCGVVISRVTKPQQGAVSSQHRFAGEAGVQNSCDGMLFCHVMEKENDDLRDIFQPHALRTIEVIGGRYWGTSAITLKLAGAEDRYVDPEGEFDDPGAWSLAQNDAWSQYKSRRRR